MTSCGTTVLPSDFDILRPSSSTTKPWVITASVRRAIARAEADEQRAVEPAAVLVAALEVDGRPATSGPAMREHGLVARARVEPHVEDVRSRSNVGSAARRAARASGTNSSAGARTRRRRRARRRRSAACSISAGVSSGSPHASCSRTPGSARPTSAGARCTSRAGWRSCCGCALRPRPAVQRDRVERRSPPQRLLARSRLVHRDEPLRRGAEDDRVLAAPAVRVAVAERLAVQRAALAQRLDDLRVGVEHLQAGEQLDLVEERRPADRRVDLEAVLLAGV